jgi:hypothetical protein
MEKGYQIKDSLFPSWKDRGRLKPSKERFQSHWSVKNTNLPLSKQGVRNIGYLKYSQIFYLKKQKKLIGQVLIRKFYVNLWSI